MVRHKLASAIIIEADDIWTNSQAIAKALQRSAPTCDDTPAGTCTAFGAPYNFDVIITFKGAVAWAVGWAVARRAVAMPCCATTDTLL